MARARDWPDRLAGFLRQRARDPFAWGSNDCALFAADATLAITGQDFAAGFRGRYATALGALRALRAAGAEDLAGYVTQVLGAPIPAAHAQRGDVVLFSAQSGPALGVVAGTRAAAPGPEGITWVPMAAWQQAWRVA